MNLFKNPTNNGDIRKLVVYPVIAGVFLTVILNVLGYLTTTRSNTTAITSLEVSKVDQKSFNEFLRMYAEFSVLTEERHIITSDRLTKLEGRQREIELEKLKVIEQNIAIIQEHMKTLLKAYGLYTRDGGEIQINPLLLIKEIDKT